MQKPFLVAVAAGIFALSGCQTTPEQAAKPKLSDEAQIALSWAQADVKDAAKAGGLWTVADDALKAAKAAADKGDSANTIKNAKKASELAKLGIGQTKYPLIPH